MVRRRSDRPALPPGNHPGPPLAGAAGVVADARILGLYVDPGLVVCFPYWELTPSNATVVARGAADTATALAVRAGLDPLLPASNVRVLDDVLAASVARGQWADRALAYSRRQAFTEPPVSAPGQFPIYRLRLWRCEPRGDIDVRRVDLDGLQCPWRPHRGC